MILSGKGNNRGLIIPDGNKPKQSKTMYMLPVNNGYFVYKSEDIDSAGTFNNNDIKLFKGYSSHKNVPGDTLSIEQYAKNNNLNYNQYNQDLLSKGYVASFNDKESANKYFNDERVDSLVDLNMFSK